jgi:hypothetical protein
MMSPDAVFARILMAAATLQIHANVVIQPCMKPQKAGARWAKCADQRYWAPTVGILV